MKIVYDMLPSFLPDHLLRRVIIRVLLQKANWT